MAVIPVILFHAGLKAFAGGYVGVDVFFVISGYLITSIILRERMSGMFTLVGFHERRARRILPALFFVMLVCLPLAWLWMLPVELEGFGQSLVAVSSFVSNVLFWRTSGYFDGAAELKPLLHTWSLGVEEQYCVLFPLFVSVFVRLGLKRLVWAVATGALISFGLGLWLTDILPAASFFLLPSRAWELLAGSLLACASIAGATPKAGPRMRGALGVLGLALIMIPVFVYDETTPFPGLAATPSVLGAVLILAFTDARSLIGRLLTLRMVLWVGAISYSAYLWHQPLFAFARLMSVGHPPAWLCLTLSCATLALAHLSWHFVEAPFRDRRKFTKRQIFTWSAVGSALFIAAGFALTGSNACYSGLGFVWPADTIKEYQALLIEAASGELKVSDAMQQDARPCFYVTRCCNWVFSIFNPADYDKWIRECFEHWQGQPAMQRMLRSLLTNTPVAELNHAARMEENR